MVDSERISERLALLRQYRDELAELRDLPVSEYLASHTYSGRYLVQVAAQLSIDLANHLIASSGWRPPSDFRDAFTVLEERGVLDGDLTRHLRDLAGLRNRLVHLYDSVDDRSLHQALGSGLDDLDGFARAIAARLD
ncbi:MAG: DUF86 domain-containing protein [Nitriliruptorales bacterium]|nr:DUF86 domain-containing protein [Nitriliruptorales bacterium]